MGGTQFGPAMMSAIAGSASLGHGFHDPERTVPDGRFMAFCMSGPQFRHGIPRAMCLRTGCHAAQVCGFPWFISGVMRLLCLWFPMVCLFVSVELKAGWLSRGSGLLSPI